MGKISRSCIAAASAVGLLAVAGAAVVVPVKGIERFHYQRVDWKRCDIEAMDAAGGRCGVVSVPLNYADPDGRTLSIAVSRVRATDPARRRGALLANPGGPGASGVDTVDLLGDVLSPQVRAEYDLIGMDPRGVGGSGGRTCGWETGEMIRSAGIGLDGFLTDTARAARLAMRCLATDPDELRQFTTRNTARDMDIVRRVLNEPALSYYGVSYGTYLGAVFAQLFPDRVDRMVLDSAIDPQRYWTGLVRDWGAADEAALDDWANWAAARDADHHLGSTAEQVRGTVENLTNTVAQQSITIDGFVIDDHWLPFLLHNLLANYRLNEKMADTVAALVSMAGGQGASAPTPWLTDTLSALRENENSSLAFITCGDDAAPENPADYWSEIEIRRAAQPVFGALAANIQPCAFWPRPVEPPTVVRNSVPALIVQSTGDPRTPYQHAVSLHRAMPASRLVTLDGVRIHMTFRPDLSRCVLDTINTYLADGTRPPTDAQCLPDVANG